MIDRFDQLLSELGQEFSIPLHPDKNGACKIKINEEFDVQLECDAAQENLLVASFLCDLPPGKYRENTLKDALKSNSPFPQYGTLAYSERNNKLTLFSFLRLELLDGRKLFDFLLLFLEKAKNWRIGVETGHTAPLASRAVQGKIL